MRFPVARASDEALLYLDLHPCACGSAETVWDNALVTVEGEPASRYEGACEECGRQRAYLFGVPEREVVATAFPTFGGDAPSELLDAGEWLWVADRTAGNVPEDDAYEALSVARAAVDEVIKFIPPGMEEVPGDAFWTERGRAVREAEPGRFRLDRLIVVRNAYRDFAAEHRG